MPLLLGAALPDNPAEDLQSSGTHQRWASDSEWKGPQRFPIRAAHPSVLSHSVLLSDLRHALVAKHFSYVGSETILTTRLQ